MNQCMIGLAALAVVGQFQTPAGRPTRVHRQTFLPSVVHIQVLDKAGVPTNTCSGALVRKNVVVTAGHCSKTADARFQVRFADLPAVEFKLHAREWSAAKDYAVLVGESPDWVTPLRIQRKRPRATDFIWGSGYPASETGENDIQYSSGGVYLAFVSEQDRHFVARATYKGESGGPLLNGAGEIVGIMVKTWGFGNAHLPLTYAVPVQQWIEALP